MTLACIDHKFLAVAMQLRLNRAGICEYMQLEPDGACPEGNQDSAQGFNPLQLAEALSNQHMPQSVAHDQDSKEQPAMRARLLTTRDFCGLLGYAGNL
jgi:hypothetical protein